MILISHTAVDESIASELEMWLKEVAGVAADSITRTGAPGRGIPFDKDVRSYFEEEIQYPTLVLPLISASYLDSHFCLVELGASYSRSSAIFPITIPPVKPALVFKTLGMAPAWSLEDPSLLSELGDALHRGGIEQEPANGVSSSNSAHKQWIGRLRGAQEPPPPPLVTKRDQSSVIAELEEWHSIVGEYELRRRRMRAGEMGRTILIADPHPLPALDMQSIFLAAGFEVVGVAQSAQHLLKLASDTKPALLVIDARLWPGVSAMEISEQVSREVGSRTVFVTAEPEIILNGTHPEAIMLATKPYNPTQLVELVEEAMTWVANKSTID